ncbi:hypothetical protein A3A03_01765 [Candidatus Nomurabacteria bacterium RIFCSPLOWO2_01_FULL_40_18]|uniref:Nucleotidyl transferase AbiEii/AbiGii toxin family protein n=1 Tax=Candidatus Nomurabacteria bacterium RIFCSPLOWO2_01_FULL_40_18 TaxID=1801773 RepID=A0A1F6XLR2_9BACT|nr:MAG: hypothetical protein A3A03_01765 [Candidatus Nomurabacteria bacterium RIFCSPLOWO2_01_FULL_40_18]
MNIPNKKDALHKAWLYRLLEAIADNQKLVKVMYFKGGTCASMLGWLPRFSVDLDFDYAGEINAVAIESTRKELENVFIELGLSIKDKSKVGIQYFLKYENPKNTQSGRNTLKIDANFPLFKSSKYAPKRFSEIDRILSCQTKETMFAHKLVAVIDRFEKTGQIAGRDIFDIHYFFLNGFEYDSAVIRERRKVKKVKEFFLQLHKFISANVTDAVITEDLSSLLPLLEFKRIRKILKREVLSLIQAEIDKFR